MKKLIIFIASVLMLGNVFLVRASDWDVLEPGSYLNPYTIEKNPFIDKYELKPKYPTGSDEDFNPGGYYNPYIIEKDPLTDEYEIKPKYSF